MGKKSEMKKGGRHLGRSLGRIRGRSVRGGMGDTEEKSERGDEGNKEKVK